jgi:hypothetical protein
MRIKIKKIMEYFPYIYVAYTIFSYSKSVYTAGKDILDIYKWVRPTIEKDENRYVDWVLVSDEVILK